MFYNQLEKVDLLPLPRVVIHSLLYTNQVHKVEIPIHDNIRESVTWECKEHGVKS
jgi:hypothetical protein